MNNNPQRECSEDPNIHTYGEYTRCLNSKLENPYTVGLEVPLKQTIGMIFGIIGMVILILLALHYFRIITLPLPVPQKK
jgi:hypothetical protein